jgi:outer membrane protein W
MKKLLVILLLLCVVAVKTNAQQKLQHKVEDRFYIGYEVGIPSGFIEKTSWRGGRLEYRHKLKSDLSFGVSMAWNSFEEYVNRNTYQKADGTGALTTDMVKSVYVLPITATIHKYIRAGKRTLPYIGVGIGTQYTDQTIYANIYGINDYNWGFNVRPEIGVDFPLNDFTAIFLSATYNYATNSYEDLGGDKLQHFAVTIGFSFGSGGY